MSRGSNQKFKFTYLMKVMLEKTDDEHALTMSQIMDELEKYDVTAERKSIYADFADMNEKFGVEIIKEQIGRETYYHVGAREYYAIIKTYTETCRRNGINEFEALKRLCEGNPYTVDEVLSKALLASGDFNHPKSIYLNHSESKINNHKRSN